MKTCTWWTLVTVGLTAAAAAAGDWPQFRYDAGRTAASPEELPAELQRLWVRQFPPPRPVYPAEVRLRFDASYEPVVQGQTLFLPSMVTDSVTALDTRTGEPCWQFFAEGPVRLAPVAWQDKVYFVSDDGHLYCLDAGSGQLRWKFQGLPPGARDRKILGNQRLISLRPAWGGPVLQDGVVYFGCGIWSAYGVCVHALDAATGRVIWTNADSNHIAGANMDHGVGNEAGLTPQGYLAVVHDRLIVPCGAQLPAFLDRQTGQLGAYCMGWGGRNGLPKGTWFVAGTSHYLSHSGDLYDIARVNDETLNDPRWPVDFKSQLYPGQFTRLGIDRSNQKDLGEFSQPVFADGVMYDNAPDIVAYDLSEATLQLRSQSPLPAHRRDDTYPDKWQGTFRQQWRWPSERRVQIKAGSRLYVSGPGVVEAIRIPSAGEEPGLVWSAQVEGTPHRLLAADGKLFVVTREGRLYAFGAGEVREAAVPAPATAPAPLPWVDEILQTSRVRQGYALVLGVDSGDLVEALARQSELDVIAVARDAGQADALRRRLHAAGLYGTRASVHVGEPLAYPLPPYLASLIVSEDWTQLGPLTGQTLREVVFPVLRPYGGTACLTLPPEQTEPLVAQLHRQLPAGAAVRTWSDGLLLSREGPLPGAAAWSHAEGGAGRSGASEDDLVRAPLDLLWFDTPRRWIRVPGATLVRICAGRILLKTDKLQAMDVYTGRKLWETPLPGHNPNDQLVAVDDAIYAAGGTACQVLDPATGAVTGQIELPNDLTGPWANLGVWQHYLVGQSGRQLLCYDRRNRQLAWRYDAGQPSLSVAVGGGKVFCAALADLRGPAADGMRTRALDIQSGQPVWQVAAGGEIRYCSALDVLVLNTEILRAADGTVVAPLQDPPRADPLTPAKNVPKPQLIAGEKLLFGTAENVVLYDLTNGRRIGDPLVWMRRGCTVPRAGPHLITTRVRGNAAYIDLESRDKVSLWNVRAACSNNLFPADGVLNAPSLTGGCTCNYIPVSQAFVPTLVIERPASSSTP